MNELWTILAPILLADIVNPVLFAFLVYAAGTGHPISNSTALLLGHTAAYFIVGIVLALGLGQIEERLANPKPVDFAFELFIGLVLLWIAIRGRSSAGKQPAADNKPLSFTSAFMLGAIVNFVGIPFAVPYFAALSQILKADIPAVEALIALAAYNILYAIPFAVVPLSRALLGEKSQLLLKKINIFLEKASRMLIPVLLVVLGVAMVADALHYFVKGEALF